jgi:cardiolipin synthase
MPGRGPHRQTSHVGRAHKPRTGKWPRFPVLAAVVLVLLPAVVASGSPRTQASRTSVDLAGVASQPVTAAYRDGTLLLTYGAGKRQVHAVARWSVDPVPEGSHEYRAAQLDLADESTLFAQDGSPLAPLTVQSREACDGLVTEVMTSIAPRAPGEAALAVVQGEEIAFFLDDRGTLRMSRLQDKPADRRVTRVVGEGGFAAQADAILGKSYGDGATLLFRCGDPAGGDSFVFFDLERRQSVLVAGLPEDEGRDLRRLLHFAAQVPDTLVLRGQALGILTRPVSSVGRLAWLVSQTAIKLVPPRFVGRSEAPPPVVARGGMDVAAWERELDAMGIAAPLPAAITPLIGGEAFFTEFVQAIQDARESISIRLFIFDNDDYAIGIADLLKRRSREVRVRVLIDSLGTLGASQGEPPAAESARRPLSVARYLRVGSEVEVREVPDPLLVLDHTKTIIVDGRQAYLGGMNIGHEYRYEWHDMMVALDGPLVGRLRRDFDRAWAHAGPGGDFAYLASLGAKEASGGGREPGHVDVRPIYTRPFDPQLLRAQLAAMRRAERAIWVEQPYVSDDTLIRALIDARARGVDVRLIVPSSGDSRFMNSANLLAASALVRNGVRVYVYPGMTHVKAALYDGWACLGSANFDKLSLRINQETNVATSDPVFVGRLRRELFEADFARSRELVEPPSAGWGTYVSAYVAGQL